jgi:glutaredoxin
MKFFASQVVLCAALMSGASFAQQDAAPVSEAIKAETQVEAVKPEAANEEPTKPERAKPEVQPAPAVAESVPSAPAVPAAYLYVPTVDNGVIVYAEPRNKSAMVGLIESGAGVYSTGEMQNGYLRISGGNITGWVDKNLLKKSSAEQMLGEARKYTDRVTRPRIAVTKVIKQEKIAPALGADGRVVLYSAAWCPFCDKARAYFQRTGVPFDEHDTEKSAKGRRDYEAMNGDGIPIVLVNNHKIVGWKQREFERHYGQAEAILQAEVAPVSAPAPVAQVARAVAPPARIIASEAGPAYAPKIASGVIVYSQPTNKSPVGGLIKGSQQVIALGEEQNGYMRIQGVTGDGWVDKSLMKKL